MVERRRGEEGSRREWSEGGWGYDQERREEGGGRRTEIGGATGRDEGRSRWAQYR